MEQNKSGTQGGFGDQNQAGVNATETVSVPTGPLKGSVSAPVEQGEMGHEVAQAISPGKTRPTQYKDSKPEAEVEELLKEHGYTGEPQTPSSDDPAKVLGPDDTFPGSGPSHPGDEGLGRR